MHTSTVQDTTKWWSEVFSLHRCTLPCFEGVREDDDIKLNERVYLFRCCSLARTVFGAIICFEAFGSLFIKRVGESKMSKSIADNRPSILHSSSDESITFEDFFDTCVKLCGWALSLNQQEWSVERSRKSR
eukprot:1801202-Amphidinium_carterae.1